MDRVDFKSEDINSEYVLKVGIVQSCRSLVQNSTIS